MTSYLTTNPHHRTVVPPGRPVRTIIPFRAQINVVAHGIRGGEFPQDDEELGADGYYENTGCHSTRGRRAVCAFKLPIAWERTEESTPCSPSGTAMTAILSITGALEFYKNCQYLAPQPHVHAMFRVEGSHLRHSTANMPTWTRIPTKHVAHNVKEHICNRVRI